MFCEKLLWFSNAVSNEPIFRQNFQQQRHSHTHTQWEPNSVGGYVFISWPVLEIPTKTSFAHVIINIDMICTLTHGSSVCTCVSVCKTKNLMKKKCGPQFYAHT